MILLMVIACLFAWQPPVPKEIVCMRANTAIRIDGRLSKAEWKNAPLLNVDDSRRKRTDTRAVIRTLWDAGNLYIAFDVEDKNLQSKQKQLDHPSLFLDDMVEFLIDTRNDKDSCWGVNDVIYHINLHGQKKDDRGSDSCITNPLWNGDAVYAIKMQGTLNDSSDVDRGYTAEISISWKELEVAPEEGSTIGIDFAIGDNGKLFDWAGASPFRSPYAFGNLVLTASSIK